MTYPVLGRRDEALSTAETEQFLRERLGDGLVSTLEEYGEFTITVSPDAWVEAATLCKEHDLLAYDMFDSLFGVDAREDGFDVVAVVYSTSRGRRLLLRARCDGGREEPTLPSLVEVFPGADWMERETWDMYGIEFTDHPGLAPRILCVENFEGWPLRKDFHLASRAAKPWPGVKEPAETDDEGNVIVRVPGPGEAPGPSGLDEVLSAQSKAANPSSEPEPEVEAEVEAETEPEVEVEEGDDGVKDAAATAEEARAEQAEARAEKAAEQAADGPVGADDDGPAIPEGTPPADEPSADGAAEQDEQ